MQIEVKTVHYVEAEWFCKEVVKAICTEEKQENKKILEAACKTGKMRPQHLNWFFWNLITDMCKVETTLSCICSLKQRSIGR